MFYQGFQEIKRSLQTGFELERWKPCDVLCEQHEWSVRAKDGPIKVKPCFLSDCEGQGSTTSLTLFLNGLLNGTRLGPINTSPITQWTTHTHTHVQQINIFNNHPRWVTWCVGELTRYPTPSHKPREINNQSRDVHPPRDHTWMLNFY